MERLSTKMNRAKDRARLVQLDITAPIRTYGIVDLLTARPHSTAQAIPEIGFTVRQENIILWTCPRLKMIVCLALQEVTAQRRARL
jgi:hypothetical protein